MRATGPAPSRRMRLDLALEARGLLPSRARARDAIKRGTVTVNGTVSAKPHQLVGDADAIALDDPAARYVSRSALKLVAGLDAGGVEVRGKTCLDLGASTGGFTQVLLERGADKVYAVDVGHGQLHDRLRADARVVNLEGRNGRDLDGNEVREPLDLLACDVSFVSVIKVLVRPLALCRAGADAVILVKPQFEVGREKIGKGGIVTDDAAIAQAVRDVVAFLSGEGWRHVLSVPSPIAGGDGNRETVAVFRKNS
jgi:23S rRNA (cytidine1920-2'-O)/16S rRNA (cytidine1409-2'-O)-methyltransferase